jgi:hypothetical protein
VAITALEKSIYDKEYRKRPYRLKVQRDRQLQKYGLTSAQYDELLKLQDGCCAICKSTHPNTDRIKYFPVDHNHETGKNRGLLCSRCNRAVGLFKDDVKLLQAAISYLERYNDL